MCILKYLLDWTFGSILKREKKKDSHFPSFCTSVSFQKIDLKPRHSLPVANCDNLSLSVFL